MSRARRRLGDDHGRVTVFFAILAPAFLALLGLVVDGGAKVRALQRADNIAAEAARAGGQAIKLGQAIGGGEKEIDPALVDDAVQNYLTAVGGGVTGSVVVDGPQQLTVTVNVPYDPFVLDFFGGKGSNVQGRATATLVVT